MKTEVLLLGKKRSGEEVRFPCLEGVQLVTSDTVKSLGVTLDASLSMEDQITMAVHWAFYHLHHGKLLVSYLTSGGLAAVIHCNGHL